MENLNRDTQGALVAIGTALIMFLFLLVISAANSNPTVGGLLFVAAVFIIIGGIIWALRQAAAKREPLTAAEEDAFTQDNDLPPRSLLQRPHYDKEGASTNKKKADLIEQTLSSFEVPAKVVAINSGPRLTQFGIEPGVIETAKRDGTVKQRKVKVSAITALADDLSLALGAWVRIQARVPGCSYVGLEVPNDDPQPVFLADVPIDGKGGLPVALGLDVAGQPVVADITNMPHALIAGATGSGKSVCINAFIASLLMRLTPHELHLLMIDPKMVELVQYNGIPHLVTPVITDMEKAAGALRWAVSEMQRRYKLLSQAGQRKITAYNEWAKAHGEQTLPYLVIVIDELADLMIQHQEEVEPLIVRLAQMARAVGMHLLLATQRPSVDVVTGLIKANIPTRIGFAVASSTDSRVILDQTGAETLLGLGDMLYVAAGTSQPQRVQGCFIDDDALSELVGHWKKSAFASAALADSAFDSAFDSASSSGQSAADHSDNSDELLPDAIALLKQHDSISTSFLQRKLRIGYVRAARIMDTLKERGLIELAHEQRSSTASRRSAAPARTNNDGKSATSAANSATAPPTKSTTTSEAYEQRIAELEAQLAAKQSGLSWNDVWPVVADLFCAVQRLERVNMKTTKTAARALGATIGREVWQMGTWREITAALAVYHKALPHPTEKEAPKTRESAENGAVNG